MAKEKMTNILDYLIWRGDLTMDHDPFNAIDALILSRFSYMDLSVISFDDANGLTIAQAYTLYRSSTPKPIIYAPQDPQLFQLMASSDRFKEARLLYRQNIFEADDVEQFFAITIEFMDHHYFLSFRGTDNTINGWKEDLLMTFDDTIPSQVDAVDYIHTVAGKTTGDLYFGGHSKGGNLAIYGALFSDPTIFDRIKGVYSFDGPGLHPHVDAMIHDSTILSKITSYIPQSSIFGKMLLHQEHQVIVHSNANDVFQHDIYTWEVIQKGFIHVNQATVTSRLFDSLFHDYLSKLSTQDRAKVVDIIFDALNACGAMTTDELTTNFGGTFITVVKHMTALDQHDSQLIKEAITVFMDSLKDGIMDELVKNLPFLTKNNDLTIK